MTVSAVPPQAGSRAAAPAAGASGSAQRLGEVAVGLLGASGGRVWLQEEGTGDGTASAVLCAATAASGQVLQVDDVPADPAWHDRLAGAPGAPGAFLGAPLVDQDDTVVGALGVTADGPRRWSAHDRGLLTELARAAVAQLELSALSGEREVDRTRLELVLAAAGVGTWEWDLVDDTVVWDARSLALYGVAAPSSDHDLDATLSRIHPDDADLVHEALASAAASGGGVEVEFRVVHPDGDVRSLHASGRAVADATGRPRRVLGVNIDVTESRTGLRRRLEASRRATGLAMVAFALSGAETEDDVLDAVLGQGTTTLGAQGGAVALLEPGADALRVTLTGDYSPQVRSAVAVTPLAADLPLALAVRTGSPVALTRREELLAQFPHLADLVQDTGTQALLAVPLHRSGQALGALLLRWSAPRELSAEDVQAVEGLAAQAAQALARVRADAAREAALAAAEAAARRLALLSDVSEVLMVPGEEALAERLGRLAQLVVPELADWSILTLADDAGRLQDAGWHHRDPSRVAEVGRYAALRTRAPAAGGAASSRLLAGEVVVLPEVTEGVLRALVTDAAAADAARALDPSGVVIAPLVARGRLLGVLTLGTTSARGAHTPDEVATAREVARRVSAALDGARLLQRSQRVAEALQRSLLTSPPDVPDLEIAVRYVPAVADARVGGDWYDAFTTATGSTQLVIGDVMGHDTAAAAAMGQLRSLVRALASDRPEGPAAVLTRADRAAQLLRVGTYATALTAELRRPEGGAPGPWRMRWHSAGHPPPLLLDPGGGVVVLESEPGLLLGLDPTTDREDEEALVPEGATLLLFTDGLVERRSQPVDVGLERLAAALDGLGAVPLEDLCDRVLTSLLAEGAEDDVALVAVRPRPGERP